jgi:ankyrin repeat protein
MSASFNGHKKTVLLLIDKGADINKCDYDEWTALTYACRKGFQDIVQMLIDNGASIDEVCEHNISPKCIGVF